MTQEEIEQNEFMLTLKYGSMPEAYNKFAYMPDVGGLLPSQLEYDVLQAYAERNNLGPILLTE